MRRVYLWRITVIATDRKGGDHQIEFHGPAPRGAGQWERWWKELQHSVWCLIHEATGDEPESFGVYLEQTLSSDDKAAWHEWRRGQLDEPNGKQRLFRTMIVSRGGV